MQQNGVQKIIHQLLTGAFYKYHALLLALVYIIMFGSVSGNVLISYHGQIIKSILTSPSFFALVFCFWFFYACHVILFLKNKIHAPENYCLLQLNALPKQSLQKYLLHINTTCLLPISTYGLLIITYGIYHAHYLPIMFIALILILLHLFGVYMLWRFLKNTEINFKLLTFYKPLPLKIYWPSVLYIKYVLNQQWLAFLLQKVVSLLAIIFVFYSRRPTDEMRLPIVLYGLSLMVCTSFIQKLVQWHETQFVHHRILPIALHKRVISIFVFCILIMLPEHIMLFKTAPLHSQYSQSVSLMVFGTVFLICQFGITYACKAVLKNTYPYVGLCMLIIYFGALADNIWLINGLLFGIGLVLFIVQYPLFEPQPNDAETV
jgi:hypothetical protein